MKVDAPELNVEGSKIKKVEMPDMKVEGTNKNEETPNIKVESPT